MAKGPSDKRPSKSPAATKDHQVRERLGELIRTLEQIESIVHVATAALEHQNADRDEDVARVLQRGVGDRISVEIEKTTALLASLRGAPEVRTRK